MAINDQISLGLGHPGNIPNFITLGLFSDTSEGGEEPPITPPLVLAIDPFAVVEVMASPRIIYALRK